MNDNKKITYGSHLALLTKVIDMSEGDIMEIGTGDFSTLIFHWFAHIYKRNVYSFENDPEWYKKALKSNSKYHKIVFVGSWDELPDKSPKGTRWGVVFVDHNPPGRRIEEIKKYADKADYIVIHDTEPGLEHHCHYSGIWSLFKYIYHDNRIGSWTSVVSNFHKLVS